MDSAIYKPYHSASDFEAIGAHQIHKIQPETANDDLHNTNTMRADNGMPAM